MPVANKLGGSPTPKVPTIAQRASDLSCLASVLRACANHQVVEVLPLVPVTAKTFKA